MKILSRKSEQSAFWQTVGHYANINETRPSERAIDVRQRAVVLFCGSLATDSASSVTEARREGRRDMIVFRRGDKDLCHECNQRANSTQKENQTIVEKKEDVR